MPDAMTRTDIDEAILGLLTRRLFVTAKSASETLGNPLGATRRSLRRLVHAEQLVGMQVSNTAWGFCRKDRLSEARQALEEAVSTDGARGAMNALALAGMAASIWEAGCGR